MPGLRGPAVVAEQEAGAVRMNGKMSTVEKVILMTARLAIIAYGYLQYTLRGGVDGDVGITNQFLLIIIMLLVMLIWPQLESIELAITAANERRED